jgi:hypothetical protein
MRSVLRKLNQGEELDAQEYQQLMDYAGQLMLNSPESYAVFYEQYASQLYRDYYTVIPRFQQSWDDLVNYLLKNPQDLHLLEIEPLPLQEFPEALHPYLQYAFQQQSDSQVLQKILRSLNQAVSNIDLLPRPRQGKIVYKYEDANSGKEIGLKSHFERLASYSFITRLQTYRYLIRSKAAVDKFEYIDGERLGGIFTNKEKSIYYFIYLSENDPVKARNACQALNIAFGK